MDKVLIIYSSNAQSNIKNALRYVSKHGKGLIKLRNTTNLFYDLETSIYQAHINNKFLILEDFNSDFLTEMVLINLSQVKRKYHDKQTGITEVFNRPDIIICAASSNPPAKVTIDFDLHFKTIKAK